MPAGTGVSGLESDGGDQFFCGGGSGGESHLPTEKAEPSGVVQTVTNGLRRWVAGDPAMWLRPR